MTADKQKFLDYLQTQHLMGLTTCDKNMWPAIVYFAVDKNFIFYLVTGPKTEHGLNLAKNPEVAVTIFDSHQPNAGDKKGVQMRGQIVMVTNLIELTKAIALWNRTNPGAEKWISLENIREKAVSSRIYKIIPEKIKLFTQVNGKDNEEVFSF